MDTMAKLETRAGSEPPASAPGVPTHDEIRAQLRDLLASPVFQSSRRGQQFIEYVVLKSLSGDVGALKERTIAVEVFGRNPDTGLAEDSIVRVGAREVRKRLAQYYATPEGSAARVVMELPSGSYAPEFRYAVAAVQPSPALESAVLTPVPVVRRHFPYAIILAAVALAAIAVLAFFALHRSRVEDPQTRAFQHFWAPAFDSSTPLLIGVGHPIVYQPSSRAARLSAQRAGRSSIPAQVPLALKPNEMDGSDMIPVLNQYVGFGDMVAANEVSQMMARHGRSVRTLLATSIPFADLRQSPTYLIGSLTNHWTMELGQNWRFQFDWSPEHRPLIRDNETHKEWMVTASEDGSTPLDYSLICRLRNSPTGGLLIVSAGIKQFGTEAAGRILAQPLQLSRILNKLPAGWEEKNVQIVLRTRIIGNTPAEPELVASHVW